MGKRVHLPSPGKCTWKCRLLRVNYILVSTKRTKIVHWLEIYLNCNCGLHWGSLQRSPRTWGIRLAAEKKGQNGEGRGGEEKGWREKEGRRHCPLLQEFPRAPVIQNPPPCSSLARYFGFTYKICSNMNTAFCSTWRQTTAVVNQARPCRAVVSPLVLSAVIYEVRRLESVVHNRPLYWRQSRRGDAWAGFFLQCKISVAYELSINMILLLTCFIGLFVWLIETNTLLFITSS